MMDIIKSVRGKMVYLIAEAVNNRIDGREITQKLDEELDKQFGINASEKIQRKTLTDFLFEMIEGLWEENPQELVTRIEIWQHDLHNESIQTYER